MATVETNTVTLTINDREITVVKGRTLVEAASEAGIEIPVFCYEPRLGAGVGACRMCLCEIEGMPKLQTACTTPAADGMVVNSHSGRAKEGQDAVLEFLLLNHPLGLPRVRQGRRVPAAGSDLPLRPRRDPHDAAQAHPRQAGAGVAADQARPRALHPLLSLHPVLGVGLGRHAAGHREPRRTLDDHHVRGPAVHQRVLGQRHRAVPGGSADLDHLSLQGAALGDPEHPHRVHRLRRGLQHLGVDSRGSRGAGAVAQPSRGGRGLAVRPRSVRPGPAARARSRHARR